MCTDRRGRAGSNAESGGRWLGIAGLDAADTRYSGLATFLASRRADAGTGIFGTDDWSVEHGCRAHRSDYRRGRGLWSVVGDFGRLSPVPGARRAGTRRCQAAGCAGRMVRVAGAALHPAVRRQSGIVAGVRLDGGWTCGRGGDAGSAGDVSRSEEHTSELQSLMRISYAVFCLKKKTKNITKYSYSDCR